MNYDEEAYVFPLVEGIEVNDFHIHISYFEDGKKNNKENFIEQLEEYRKDFKINKMSIACIPHCDNFDICQNLLAAILKLEYPEYYVHGGLIYPSYPVSLPLPDGFSAKQQLEDMMSIGFDGIKMLETKPNVRKILSISPADESFEPYFAMLEEKQIHILWHVADPETSWSPEHIDKNHPDWSYSGEGFLSFEESLQEVYDVLKRHPKLKVTFAHLFFYENYPEKLVDLFETYPNVCVDITPHTFMFGAMSKNREVWREIFTKYSDRIIFGSDYCSENGKIRAIGHHNVYRFLLTNDEYMFWNGMPAHGLGLDKSDAEKILGKNFRRLLGDTPKLINVDALKEYVKKYECTIRDMGQKEKIMSYFREKGII